MTKPKRWSIEWSKKADKCFQKLDATVQKRIKTFLNEDLLKLDDPRGIGKPLGGPLKALWRYRVGDYRLVCEVRDHQFVILLVTVAHRREVYSRARH